MCEALGAEVLYKQKVQLWADMGSMPATPTFRRLWKKGPELET